MSLHTKSGFSRIFSCCSHWQECQMGKIEEKCFYRESDPETMHSCNAYNRNRKNEESIELEKAFRYFDALFQNDTQ